MFKLYLTAILLLFIRFCFAQEAKVDSTFGINGSVNVPVGAYDEGTINEGNIRNLYLMNDGKLLATGACAVSDSGFNTFFMARFLTDVTLDNTFNDSGKVIYTSGRFPLNASGGASVMQTDGKIVMTGPLENTSGNNDMGVVRFNASTGLLDSTFGTNGTARIAVPNVQVGADVLAIDSLGNIIVGGSIYDENASEGKYLMARLTPNGQPDATFGMGGSLIFYDTLVLYSNAQITALLPQGSKILAGGTFYDDNTGGYFCTIYRLNNDGSIDSTFATNGRIKGAVYEQAGINQFLQLDEGKWLSLQLVDTGTQLYRYNADGVPDYSFGGIGYATIAFNSSVFPDFAQVIVGQDGSYILAGTLNAPYSNFMCIARITANGVWDTNFGTSEGGGTALNPNYTFAGGDALVQLSDGDIMLGGSSFEIGTILTRYTINSTLGIAEPVKGEMSIYPNPSSGWFNVYTPQTAIGANLQVYNSIGELVLQQALNEVFNKINLTTSSSGIYLLKITTQNDELLDIQKIVKE